MIVASGEAAAGAWTQDRGHGEVITTITATRADTAFDAFGDKTSAPHFAKEDYESYAEYGLSDRTTALVHMRYTHLHPDPPSGDASGLAESELGLRRRLWTRKRSVISLQGSLFLPAGTALTSGGFDAELRALSGANFKLWRVTGFLNSEVAYRHRANHYRDELRADLTIGINLTARWLALAQSFNVITVGTGRTNAFYGEESKVSLSIVGRLSPHWSAQLGGLMVVAGTGVPRERGALAALWYRF